MINEHVGETKREHEKNREHETIFEKSNSRFTLYLPFKIGDYCGFLKIGSPFLNADH